jgi:GDP-D-mannose 3',5'-epimerase
MRTVTVRFGLFACVGTARIPIPQVLGWEPSIKLADGLARTYKWIQGEIQKELAAGGTLDPYKTSKIVTSYAPSAIGEVKMHQDQ